MMERLEGSVLFVSTESTVALYSSGCSVCLQRASLAFTSINASSGAGVSVYRPAMSFLIAPT